MNWIKNAWKMETWPESVRTPLKWAIAVLSIVIVLSCAGGFTYDYLLGGNEKRAPEFVHEPVRNWLVCPSVLSSSVKLRKKWIEGLPEDYGSLCVSGGTVVYSDCTEMPDPRDVEIRAKGDNRHHFELYESDGIFDGGVVKNSNFPGIRVMYISTDQPDRLLFRHEAGHALGYGHSTLASSWMYDKGRGRYPSGMNRCGK